METLRSVINERLKHWSENMDDTQREINRLLSQLDDAAVGMEAKWGVGFLEGAVSFATAEKWQRQCEKIREVVESRDILALGELCRGAVRGYTALENEAIARGNLPKEPMFWEIVVDGVVYVFVKNVSDAKRLHRPDRKNVVIMTIEEAARMDIAARRKIDAPFSKGRQLEKASEFDFVKGDAVPF